MNIWKKISLTGAVIVLAALNAAVFGQSLKLQALLEPQTGEKFQLTVQAAIPSGFYLYAHQQDIGSSETKIPQAVKFNLPPGWVKNGEIGESAPLVVEDPFFERELNVHRDLVEFTLELNIPLAALLSDDYQADIVYQLCSDRICYLPASQTFGIDYK